MTKVAIHKAYSDNRYKILERDNNECFYCGSAENLQIDHIIPIKLGGTGLLVNLVTACRTCNFEKGAKLLSPALIYLVLLRNCIQNMGLSDYAGLEKIMIDKTNIVSYKKKKKRKEEKEREEEKLYEPKIIKITKYKLMSIEKENGFEIKPIKVTEYIYK